MQSIQQDEKDHESLRVSSAGIATTKVDFGIKVRNVDLEMLKQSLPYYEYSFISNQLLKRIAAKNTPETFKMLRGICRLMELTEIEIVFWTLLNDYYDYGKQLNPKYQQQLKIVAFNGFKDYLSIEDIENVAIYKRSLLFATLSAYYTLKTLRQIDRIDKITEFIKEDTFLKLLQFLMPTFEEATKLITIFKLNQTYNQLIQQQEPKVTDEIDYNYIVDQVLEMAPAYQKDDDVPAVHKVKRQKKLMVKKQQQLEKQEPEQIIQQIEPLPHQTYPIDEQPCQLQRQNSGGMFLRSSQAVFKFNSVDSIFGQQSLNQFFPQEFYMNQSSKFNILSKKELK